MASAGLIACHTSASKRSPSPGTCPFQLLLLLEYIRPLIVDFGDRSPYEGFPFALKRSPFMEGAAERDNGRRSAFSREPVPLLQSEYTTPDDGAGLARDEELGQGTLRHCFPKALHDRCNIGRLTLDGELTWPNQGR